MAFSEPPRPERPSARTSRPAVVVGLVLAGAMLAGVLSYAALAAFDRPGGSASASALVSDSASPGAPLFPLPPVAGSSDSAAWAGTVWPAHGQAAFVETGPSGGLARIQAGPNQHPAPIASVTKVMTAYLVLRDHPLKAGQDGPALVLTAADVADTARRRGLHQSIVPVAAGEHLTERQALEALLLPSANNIAAVLAHWDAGSVDVFVAQMNATARALGMNDTRYTDPSGFDQATVSTAADQVRVVDRAMGLPAFAAIVAMPAAALPVAGTVANTDTLLGHDGFVGVKTGSDNAAGGCFAFQAVRSIGGRQTTITGVVLGQPGSDQIAAGLMAAKGLVDRIAGR